jgi:hypothetical protein
MKTLEELKREAENAVLFRGHTLPEKGWKDYENREGAQIRCPRCTRQVHVLVAPRPNEVEIGGEAVVVNCQPPLTLKQAKELERGDMLYHRTHSNSDGTPMRWRVNGKPKTWKRNPERVQVPVKHGMYDYDYVTENDLNMVSLEGTEW